jgi:hypothetical protein
MTVAAKAAKTRKKGISRKKAKKGGRRTAQKKMPKKSSVGTA